MEAICEIDLAVDGAPSIIIRDLSEFVTLPFLASFDIHTAASADSDTADGTAKEVHSGAKSVTYIALTKKAMPTLVDMFFQFKSNPSIYVDETVEAVLSVTIFANFYILISLLMM